MNIFASPIDTSTEQGDLKHLALQLRVAKELENCPATLEYLQIQAHSSMLDLLDLDALGSRTDVNLRTHLAKTVGLKEAYQHLHELATTAATIEETYVTKTRGE